MNIGTIEIRVLNLDTEEKFTPEEFLTIGPRLREITTPPMTWEQAEQVISNVATLSELGPLGALEGNAGYRGISVVLPTPGTNVSDMAYFVLDQLDLGKSGAGKIIGSYSFTHDQATLLQKFR
jgi:hypothetical protein